MTGSVIAKILSDNDLNAHQLANKLGVHPTRIYDLLSGKRSVITPKFAETIRNSFPRYSRAWLLSGEGDPYGDAQSEPTCPKCHRCVEDAEVIEEIPYASKDIVEAREIDLQKEVLSGSTLLGTTSLSQILQRFDYIQPVISGDMSPFFKLGDLVFLRFLPADAELVDGEVYSIDTVKWGGRLRRVKIEGDGCYRLTATNKGYDDILLRREDIRSVAIVVHLLRTGCSPSYSLLNDFESQSRNMSQVLNQQDELIAEIRKQNERNEKLIDYIIDRGRRRDDEKEKEQNDNPLGL